MKCSFCGANTWISHGTGRAVRCKSCVDIKKSSTHVYFQEPSVKSEEALFKIEEASVKPEEIPVQPEETSFLSGVSFSFPPKSRPSTPSST